MSSTYQEIAERVHDMKYICPCKDCLDRTITCHTECDKYSKWREDLDERNRQNKPNVDAVSYTIERVYKCRKQANRLKRRIKYGQ